MKKFFKTAAPILILICVLSLWFNQNEAQSSLSSITKTNIESKKVRISTGDIEVIVTLNDSKAAEDFVTLLPITTTLVERNNFAKSMRLPRNLVTDEKTTRNYELGNLNYWDDGPSVSIVYNDIYEQTIVPIIPIGKAGNEAKKLSNASGLVTLELVQEKK